MNETMESGKKKLASLYHDLDGLIGYIECIQAESDNADLNLNLKDITKKIKTTQAQMVEAVVKDVMGVYLPLEKNDMVQDINLDQAVALIKEVERQAKQWGMSVVTSVYNSAARPVAVHCMDQSYIASFDVANNKAYTSAALKMSTIILKNLSQPGQELYGIQHTNEGKIVIFGGGEPLIHNGRIIGSIGVSGGTEEEDTKLAEFGKNKLKEVMTWS